MIIHVKTGSRLVFADDLNSRNSQPEFGQLAMEAHS